jgi:hypothetical protein
MENIPTPTPTEPTPTPTPVFPQPVPPRKQRNLIWIPIVIASILLVCLLTVVGAGVFAFRNGYLLIPGINTRNARTMPGFVVPKLNNGQKGTQNNTTGKITVEPFNPQTRNNYPALQNLVPNWINPTAPGTNTYNVSVPANQPVLLAEGWCTTTQPILIENFQHITYLVTIDGQSLDVSSLYQGTSMSNNQICRDYVGIIQSWPSGSHTISITMRLDAKINDGMSDFVAGDYIEVYKITVIP